MTETLQEVNSNTSSAPVQKANYVVDEGFDVTEASSCNEGDLSAAKGSKKFVDEDSRSPEYRSDEWRMENFKVRQLSFQFLSSPSKVQPPPWKRFNLGLMAICMHYACISVSGRRALYNRQGPVVKVTALTKMGYITLRKTLLNSPERSRQDCLDAGSTVLEAICSRLDDMSGTLLCHSSARGSYNEIRCSLFLVACSMLIQGRRQEEGTPKSIPTTGLPVQI